MRIIQINTTYGDSDSTGRTTKEMHEWLLDHGVESDVFCSSINDNSLPNKSVHVFSSKIEMCIHAALSRITGLQGYYSVLDTVRLIVSLKKRNPDVIVLRILHSNNINFPLLFRYLSKYKVPSVVVMHDCFFITGHCCHYLEYGCQKWKNVCKNCAGIKDWNKSLFLDNSYKCFIDKKRWFSELDRVAVIGVSEWTKAAAKDSILRDAFVIDRIYNWIDFDVFHYRDSANRVKRKMGIGVEKKIILAVASGWTERKGLKTVLRVAEENRECIVLMCGKIDQTDEFPPNIMCIGSVNNMDLLADLYSASDVFINASIQETFGKSTAESLACGTPVVAFDTSGSSELIDENKGLLIPMGEMDTFVKGVSAVIEKGKAAYRDNCIRFAREFFDMDKNMGDYLNCFAKLLGS